MTGVVELTPWDGDPAVRCDRGVTFVAPAERARHAPDVCLAVVERGSLLARCSCWINRDSRLGVIGHYAAAEAETGAALLAHASGALARAGCEVAVGPMDGNTWRRYRLVIDGDGRAPFFLEPANPDDWPDHWRVAGFAPCATYTSAVNDDLSVEDPRTSGSRARLARRGISIRTFDPARGDADLRRIFELSTSAFGNNPFFAPITEEEFRAQMAGVLPFARPELILLAERGAGLAGFIFAVPDLLRARDGRPPDTVILKTVGVHPTVSGMGLGGVLMDLAQRAARQLGYRRAIHALMHDANPSRKISERYARTMRRYALFSRPLAAGAQ